jgi:hypothetical protein
MGKFGAPDWWIYAKTYVSERNTKTYRSIVDKTDGATNQITSCRVKSLMAL